MWENLKNHIKKINSFIIQLEKHNIKVLNAISENDEYLIIYYKKETYNFILEVESIFNKLNNHEEVTIKYQEFTKIKNILETNFKNYENN